MGRVRANLRSFHRRAEAAGVEVRPHVKGHRMPDVARLQGRKVALTSAAEAGPYLEMGVDDVVVAYPWREPWRWRLFARLAARCRTSVHVDCLDAVHGLAADAASAGTQVGIRVEVNTGYGGRGVTPAEAPRLAQAAARAPGLRLEGVTGYAGPGTESELRSRFTIGHHHATTLVSIAQALRRQGLPCPVVCAGGTPTAAGAMSVHGITEVVAGAYALGDAGLAAAGFCAFSDVAISVHPTAAPLLDGCAQEWSTPSDTTTSPLHTHHATTSTPTTSTPTTTSTSNSTSTIATSTIAASATATSAATSTSTSTAAASTTGSLRRHRPDDQSGPQADPSLLVQGAPPEGCRADGWLLPGHVCALVLKVRRVLAVDGTEVVGEWPVVRVPDQEG